jgi:hypothetical protein
MPPTSSDYTCLPHASSPKRGTRGTTPDTVCLTASGRSRGVPCGGEIWLCAPPTGIARVHEAADTSVWLSGWKPELRDGYAAEDRMCVTSAPAPQRPPHISPPCGDPWQRVRHAQPLHRALTCRDATRMRACPTVRPPRRVTRCGRATSAAARPAMRTAHSSGASCTAVAGATAVHEALVARRICHAAREQIHGPRRAAPSWCYGLRLAGRAVCRGRAVWCYGLHISPTGIARVSHATRGYPAPPRTGLLSGRHDRMALGLEARAT